MFYGICAQTLLPGFRTLHFKKLLTPNQTPIRVHPFHPHPSAFPGTSIHFQPTPLPHPSALPKAHCVSFPRFTPYPLLSTPYSLHPQTLDDSLRLKVHCHPTSKGQGTHTRHTESSNEESLDAVARRGAGHPSLLA